MAYTRALPARRCQTCGKPAKIEVFGIRNASYGVYCTPCGNRKVKIVRASEAMQDNPPTC